MSDVLQELRSEGPKWRGQDAPVVKGKGGAFWKKQVELALTVRSNYETWWEANLKAYAPIDRSPETYGQDISTNRTFTLTERKKADLFYQRPDVTLQPSPLMERPQLDAAGQPVPNPLTAHEAIVNEKLGEDGIDATTMMDAVLFDIIATQGAGFTMMGYESFTVTTPTGRMDEFGATLLGPDGEPETAEVPIHESCFWHHFSGKQAIIPHNFRSTDWDKAPFLGMQFELPLTAGNRKKYRLPDEFEGSKSATTQHYNHGTDLGPPEQVFTGVLIWYRSMLYRDDQPHPEHFTRLVLVDGIPEPVIEEDSPYQTLDARGQLTPDSLIGNPIHPFSVRTLPDSAYVPSDGTMIRPLENELNVFRTQMVQFRDASVLRYIANSDVLPPEALTKIVRSPIGGITSVPSEAFVGDGAIKPLEGGSMPRESFLSNDYIDKDLARTVSSDAMQEGAQGESRTATADQITQSNANARQEKERGVLLKRYLKGVTKFSTLVQRFLPVQQAAAIVGPDVAMVWDQWRRTVPSSLAFTAMPDSALRVDQAVDRKQWMDFYSFVRQDPWVQKGIPKLLERGFRKHHIDPTGIIAAPDPPKPEPPKLSIAIKGEDFVGPQAPVIFEIAAQLGLVISDAAKAQTQALGALMAAVNAQAEATKPAGDTKHGGKMPQSENLSKHHADLTGGMQGSGAPAPLGAGGMVQ